MTDTQRLRRASELAELIRRELWAVAPPEVPEFRQFYERVVSLQVELARALTSLECLYPHEPKGSRP